MEMELIALRNKVQLLERSLQKRLEVKSNSHIWDYRIGEYAQKALGLNPCAHESEFVSFQDHNVSFELMGSTSLRNYGPLSWVAMVKGDPALNPTIGYRHSEVLRQQTKKDSGTLSDLFASRMKSDPIVNEELDFKPYFQISRTQRLEKEKLISYNLLARKLGFAVCPTDLLQESDMLEKIRLLIPPKRAMWKYIDLYFDKVYPFLPFLDQETFESNVRRLVVNSSDDSPPQLKVVKQMDLVYLAHLLLVLRFGYLNLFTAIPKHDELKDEEREYFLDNPVALEALEVAQLCLQLFNHFRTCNLPVLQLLLLIKVYYLYGPEYGPVPEHTNTQATISLLIKMGMSLGLHREPENLKVVNKDLKNNHLHRKLWYCLLCLDYEACIINGFPVSIKKNNFDTEIPHYVVGTENVKNENIDKVLTKHLFQINNCYELTNPILDQITSIRIPTALKSLCADLTGWELKYFKNVSLCLKSIEVPLTIENVYDSIMFFNMSVLFTSIIYHLFLYYERVGNVELSYFYFKKLFISVVRQIVILAKRFVQLSNIWFTHSSHVVFVPTFQNFIHRGMVILQGLLVRTRFSILKCETLSSHNFNLNIDSQYALYYNTLKKVFENATTCILTITDCVNKLSSRYCYSWSCSKAQESLQAARNGEDYYLNYCRGKEVYLNLDTEMVVDLEKVLSETLVEVQSHTKQGLGQISQTESAFKKGATPINNASANVDASMDYLNLFWQQMHQMKAYADESMLDPTHTSFFDLDFTNTL